MAGVCVVVVLDSSCFVAKENPLAEGGGTPKENAPEVFESVGGVVSEAVAPKENGAFPLEVVADAGVPKENGAFPLVVVPDADFPKENGAFPLEVVPVAGAPNENGAFPLGVVPVADAGADAVVGATTPNEKSAEVPDEAPFTVVDEAAASAS